MMIMISVFHSIHGYEEAENKRTTLNFLLFFCLPSSEKVDFPIFFYHFMEENLLEDKKAGSSVPGSK